MESQKKTLLEKISEKKESLNLDSDLKEENLEDSSAIRDILYTNRQLKELNLNSNALGDNEGEKLRIYVNLLKSGSTLKSLSLSGNNISSKGLAIITQALEKNSLLTQLDLSCNQIDDKAVPLLAGLLEKNKSLLNLNLCGNLFKRIGLFFLAESLEKNSTLLECHLDPNLKDSKDLSNIYRIKNELALNKALKCVHQQLSEFANEQEKKLQLSLKEKSSLCFKHLFSFDYKTKLFIEQAITLGYKDEMEKIFAPKNIQLENYPWLFRGLLMKSSTPLFFQLPLRNQELNKASKLNHLNGGIKMKY